MTRGIRWFRIIVKKEVNIEVIHNEVVGQAHMESYALKSSSMLIMKTELQDLLRM
ncbi:hypothetical protein DPMN_075887 [Dreissena polymorpha]|uniref:Uncharacterized protein n=1 Tax=Dreissena polymorpha TaxID=45954 RepID=A0A9D4BN41_DREPO|nr:hypothetical protein DPMN_075887 [Dreissena polymorpha]